MISKDKNKFIIGIMLFIIILLMLYIILKNNNLSYAFYSDNELLDKMPSKNNSDNLLFAYAECDNGTSIEWDKNEWAPLVKKLNKNKTKCRLYFKKMYDDKHIYNLTKNNINGTFMNGALIKDDNGIKGIYFDGKDDYVDIDDLPSTIDWNNGITIEFKAKWLSLNSWARIFDFGNGEQQDNILIANYGIENTIVFDTKYNNDTRRVMAENQINLNEIIDVKIEVIKNDNGYLNNVYINNSLLKSQLSEVNDFLYNINRTENFLGKSNWIADGYFNGYIYYFKISDKNNNPILLYDLNNN